MTERSEGASREPIRVLVLGDDSLCMRLLSRWLRELPEFGSVETARDLEEAALVSPQAPHVVLYEDFSCAGADGHLSLRDCIRAFPGSHALVIGSTADEQRIMSALEWGACGYVSKQDDPEQIVERIIQAGRGELALDAETAQMVLQRMREMTRSAQAWQTQPLEGMNEPLSGRELEVLRLVAEGMTNRQIGLALGIAENTVKNHLHSLFGKLGVDSRTRALSEAVRRGILVV